jgi:hypothetical protein
VSSTQNKKEKPNIDLCPVEVKPKIALSISLRFFNVGHLKTPVNSAPNYVIHIRIDLRRGYFEHLL